MKDKGRLLAMAGERMKIDGMSEVSGVCTRPEAQGKGLARLLSLHVAAEIDARGEKPFLHAYATNLPAIRLYQSLGFGIRTELDVAVISRAG